MIILYSTGCPKCQVLAAKLDAAHIKYEINPDVDDLINAGFYSAPGLKVDDKLMNFTEAIQWIKEYLNGDD